MIQRTAVRASRRLMSILAFTISITCLVSIAKGQAAAEAYSVSLDRQAVEARVGQEIEWLASEELEGRGVQTKGIEIAAEYIREEFQKAGLLSGVEDGSYYQTFEMPIRNSLVKEKCELILSKSGGEAVSVELTITDEYVPQLIGGSGAVSGDLVFVGYGISSEGEAFQEYEGVDVEGKVLVIVSGQPKSSNPESVFGGDEPSELAYVLTKVNQARELGAAGILFVNNPAVVEEAGTDELVEPAVYGSQAIGLPFAHVTNEAVNKMLAASPLKDADGNEIASLAAAQAYIDSNMKPLSQPLAGWAAEMECTFETIQIEASNVVGVIEGEGSLAHETIVIGGHYDHLGYGGRGSRAPGRYEIHYGADDNATGTSAVLELARRFAMTAQEDKPRRRLVFIAFSAEESGLIGSRYYIENPLFSLDDTIAMINFDMIGRLRNNALTLYGANSGEEFGELCKQAADGSELELIIPPSGFAGSDHLPFYQRQIPDIFIHTGLTDVYHTPEDTFATINVPGAVDVIDFSERLLGSIDAMSGRPTFVEAAPRTPRRQIGYLGAEPDFGSSEEGMYIRSVTEGSPAAEAGIQTGDVIIEIAGEKVVDQRGLFQVLRSNAPGSKIKVVVLREEETLEMEVTLGESTGGARGRGGRGGGNRGGAGNRGGGNRGGGNRGGGDGGQ